jgi:hypothetical protein
MTLNFAILSKVKIDLTQNNLAILDGLDSNLYAFSYYSSEKDAAKNSNPLNQLSDPNIKTITIWVKYQRVKSKLLYHHVFQYRQTHYQK